MFRLFHDLRLQTWLMAHLDKVRERGAGSLPVAPQAAAHLCQDLLHNGCKVLVHGLLGVVDEGAPDVGHSVPHPWVGVMLVPVQLRHQLSYIRLQLLPSQLGNRCKAAWSALLIIELLFMFRQNPGDAEGLSNLDTGC